jgi:hypothetical protein
MMKFSIVLLLSLLCSVQNSWALDCAPTSAVDAATKFLSALDQSRIFSVPTREQLKALRGAVTPDLYSLLKKASRAEEREFAKTRGKEPPLYEGSLFSSLAEGYSSYSITAPTTAQAIDLIAIQFQFVGNTPATSTPYNWTDYVSVQTVSGKCLVSDMTFDKERPPEKLLSKTLKEISGD